MEKELKILDETMKKDIKDIKEKYSKLKIQVKKKYKEIEKEKKKLERDEQKKIRKSIPKSLKNQVWDKHIGKEKGIGKCNVCKIEIDSKNFECGHIISVKQNGETNINNLLPICSPCNKSMGIENLNEFKKKYFNSKNNNKKKNFIKKEYIENKIKYNKEVFQVEVKKPIHSSLAGFEECYEPQYDLICKKREITLNDIYDFYIEWLENNYNEEFKKINENKEKEDIKNELKKIMINKFGEPIAINKTKKFDILNLQFIEDGWENLEIVDNDGQIYYT